VLGDLNEGPGPDYFEQLYLSHNVTDIMVGSAFQPERIFAHAQHDVPAAERHTARSVRCTDGRASQDEQAAKLLPLPRLEYRVSLVHEQGSGAEAVSAGGGFGSRLCGGGDNGCGDVRARCQPGGGAAPPGA
jgi:hypothetical protein